jgi:hypothetical protein
MRTKVIVVDDFYTKPDAVRALALKSDYSSGAKYNYPGYQSQKRFDAVAIKESFEEIIGRPIEVDTDRFTFGIPHRHRRDRGDDEGTC